MADSLVARCEACELVFGLEDMGFASPAENCAECGGPLYVLTPGELVDLVGVEEAFRIVYVAGWMHGWNACGGGVRDSIEANRDALGVDGAVAAALEAAQ